MRYGWQAAFIATGLVGLDLGLLLVAASIAGRRSIRSVSPAELAYIESDPPDPPVHDAAGATCSRSARPGPSPSASFSPTPIWWFYLFWFAKFMNDQFGVEHQEHRPADDHGLSAGRRRLDRRRLAELAGCWARLDGQRRPQDGDADLRDLRRARRFAPLPTRSADMTPSGSPCLLIGMAAAAHQGFSCNLFTLTSDMFPRRVVGSVVGIGGFAGAMGGFLMNLGAGWLKDYDRQLHRHVRDRRLRLPDGAADHSPARPAAGTVPIEVPEST